MTRRRILGLVIFVAGYVTSIVLYVVGGAGHPHQIGDSLAGGGTTVTVDIETIESDNSLLRANLAVSPRPDLLDSSTHSLKEDLTVVATSAVTSGRRTWPKGSLPEVLPVSVTLTGDVADWPFDTYRSGPVSVELFSGAAQVPERAPVILVDRLLGWGVDVSRPGTDDAHTAYQLDLHRTLSTAAFGVVVLGVLIALAGLGFFVAVQTMRDRRKFQPPMTTWYAAMLFAVMPLRNALPDSPPFGSWIDVSVVLWVIVVLTVSLVLYISCWWRHLAPDFDTQPSPEDRTA